MVLIILYYRYCKIDGILDQMTAIANVNVPFLSDRLTRVALAAFNGELNSVIADSGTYFNGASIDYYNGCKNLATLMQYFTD